MSETEEKPRTTLVNLAFVSAINVVFWVLALLVAAIHLPGTACFEKLLPVLIGGAFVASTAAVVAWKSGRH